MTKESINSSTSNNFTSFFAGIAFAGSLALTQSSVTQEKIIDTIKSTGAWGIEKNYFKEPELHENQDIFVSFENLENLNAVEVSDWHNFANQLTSNHKNTSFRRYFLSQILQESRWNPNPYNSRSSAVGLGQIIPHQFIADADWSVRGIRYLRMLRDLEKKNPGIFANFPEDLQTEMVGIFDDITPHQWNWLVQKLANNLSNPYVNLTISYMILELKLHEVTVHYPERGIISENLYSDVKHWHVFLWNDFEKFLQKIHSATQDEVKMIAAVGRYNGNKEFISSPQNADMERIDLDESAKNELPEYIQHMNRVSYFSDNYVKNFAKYSIYKDYIQYDAQNNTLNLQQYHNF